MIIAIDFDGVLCQNRFPGIGAPKYKTIDLVKKLIAQGHEVILWTSRNGLELDHAVSWCADMGLNFCAVNDNAPSNKEQYSAKYGTETRKVYADIYIDDHNLEYVVEDREMGAGDKWVMDYLEEVLKWQQKEED